MKLNKKKWLQTVKYWTISDIDGNTVRFNNNGTKAVEIVTHACSLLKTYYKLFNFCELLKVRKLINSINEYNGTQYLTVRYYKH